MGEAAQDSRAGEVLGSYTLIEVETSDGTCEAYRATDSRDSREVTVRVLRPEFALQSAVVQSFVSGPRTLSGLDHPNVTQVIAVESDDTGIPYVVEERVRGQLLSQMLEAFPDGMPLGVAMNVLPPIVEAVDAAHTQGIVHGCIDADHVMLAMVEGCSVPKVIGFGSADDGHCRAPEVIAGGGRDARADIWSIGALFYQTLSGQPPQGATAEPGHVDLDEIAPHLPAALCSLVGQCLMRDPGSRVESDALSMQLGMLRQQLSGVGKAKSAVARKPDAATKRMPLRRDASAPIESIRQPPPMPPPPAARADEEPEAFDPFAKKASPSIVPPAADESPPGLPPMQAPPAMGASSPPPAAR
ncbi:MAG: protein kinase, partial [Myxococcales bacterium]|nr:protein kinase [Myxococcales bacterium]